jgi:predicted PurR-regulated permease PerM
MNQPGYERFWQFEQLVRLILLFILLAACIELMAPFLSAVVWGGILAITLWPLFRRVNWRLGGRSGLTASLFGLLLLVGLAMPLALVGLALAEGTAHVVHWVPKLQHLKLPPLPAGVADWPFGAEMTLAWSRATAHLGELLQQTLPFLQDTGLWLLKQSTVAGAAVLQVLLAIIVASGFLARYSESNDFVLRFMRRIAGNRGPEFLLLASRTIRGVSLGVIGTSLLQALLTLLGLLITDTPGSSILAFIAFLLAVVQIPVLLVWGPVALWLYYSGEVYWALGLTLWGILVVGMVDNLVKPYLISHEAKMPLLLIFLGVIGGIITWGIIGLFVGPTVLALGYTLLQSWLYQPDHTGHPPINGSQR